MNIVLVDDDITFSNKLEADIKLYFKCLDEKINFIVLNDSFETIRDIDQIDLIFLRMIKFMFFHKKDKKKLI